MRSEVQKLFPRHQLMIAVFSLVALLPSFYNGIPTGPDQTQHFQSASSVYRSLVSGDIYPSITGGVDHDFGYYRLRFYPPLTYYVLAIGKILARDWYFAMLWSFAITFFAGGIGVYLWAREELGPVQAVIAAATYVFAPYHLTQLYNSFLLAEFFAMAIIPYCFLFVLRISQRRRWIDVCGLSVAYALLILTHLPITIIGSAALALYALFLFRAGESLRTLIRLFIAVSSGILLTAFYWSRWVGELDLINHSYAQYFSGSFDYRNNFLMRADQLLDFGNDPLNLWLLDWVLIATLLISVPTVIFMLQDRAHRTRYLIVALVVLVFSALMTTPMTSAMWDNFAAMQRVQFPWRWLAIVSLFGSVFASVGIVRASEVLRTSRNLFYPAGLILILAFFVFTAVAIVKGPVYAGRDAVNNEMELSYTSNGCECWWPVWAKPSAFDQKQMATAGDRPIDVADDLPTKKHFTVGAGEPLLATIAAFYYPRWNATINGRQVTVDKSDNGKILLAIPAERSEVQLEFREPAFVSAAYIASTFAWLFVIVLTAALLSRRSTFRPQ